MRFQCNGVRPGDPEAPNNVWHKKFLLLPLRLAKYQEVGGGDYIYCMPGFGKPVVQVVWLETVWRKSRDGDSQEPWLYLLVDEEIPGRELLNVAGEEK